MRGDSFEELGLTLEFYFSEMAKRGIDHRNEQFRCF